MGVVKKVIYRDDSALSSPRHRNLFLDMEENIHIHYRDLRIELSRAEFEEFSAAFNSQSKELLQIITDKNYQDGVLANANQEDVRIWTESRLSTDVKYHPRRISLEDCGDGYHLHYRQYKILLDDIDFRELTRIFSSVDIDAPYARSYDEVLQLIKDNDVDFTLDASNVPGKILGLKVAKYHLPKVRDIFQYIGFNTTSENNIRVYEGEVLKVFVTHDEFKVPADYKKIREYSDSYRLFDFISKNKNSISVDDINLIKSQVVDLYYTVKSGTVVNVESDPECWLYLPATKKVIYPYSSSGLSGAKDADALYKKWSALVALYDIGFIKPTKKSFDKKYQNELYEKILSTIKNNVATKSAVERVWIMGSAARKDMGTYNAPFVHGRMLKLGSDIDILIEIDPTREADVPKDWHLINTMSSNKCAVYHLEQIPIISDIGYWENLLPHTPLTQHLIDAYVYFPSRGFSKERDAFLNRFKAICIYDRSKEGVIHSSGKLGELSRIVAEHYPLDDVIVEAMNVSTENEVYKVYSKQGIYLLKLFKVSGNYPQSRVEEHVFYEFDLIARLVDLGVKTAKIVPVKTGGVLKVNDHPALLFEFLPGVINKKPEYDIDAYSRSLSSLHLAQINNEIELPELFTFKDTAKIWLDAYPGYLELADRSESLKLSFDIMNRVYDSVSDLEKLAKNSKGVEILHNHGDVASKNIMIDNGEAVFFDFNNAFYGPRIIDVLDGAFELSMAEKYMDEIDFSRFHVFVDSYRAYAPFNKAEEKNIHYWVVLLGLIKFTKEIRVMVSGDKSGLREKRAHAIANFISSLN
ncbi:phosphotransferase [Oceanospirillum multiglobuliferum]|uniref:Aminoglycoside phosphotransferase domain-containing protein n=1 Tax=Oceanospirillum multiglobuliferum TaxID=64969 RepID=A0A1V4TA60_9GAMM|nr:phosphotransferase [Oceanospirillum multiglobuliferum]OPX57088.1 hypothetical protein BTE48_01270 [Oceanospirillum multiglobuliferum]